MFITDDAMEIIRKSGIDIQEVIYLFGCRKIIPLKWNLFRYKGNINCSICLEEDIINGYKLNCEHKFHKHCLKKWAKINKICPNCRMMF
jgi:hypothetical protein